jgi:hypothetical protein
MKTKLILGCTQFRHEQLGIHAVVNARAGMQVLNHLSLDDIELRRDANKIRDYLNRRIRFYQFNSKFFRKHKAKLQHLLSSYND